MAASPRSAATPPCSGFCRDCQTTHALGSGDARSHALALMREFERIHRLDYGVSDEQSDRRLHFDQLLPGDRGHMFGVLECRDERGDTVVLRAFSSLRGGIREVDGWVAPILSADSFYTVVLPGIQQIQRATDELDALVPGSARGAALKGDRTRQSQRLWRRMRELYQFRNFRGETRSLPDAFFHRPGAKGTIPAGVGECCAPKLLNHAARNGLTPVGIAEFYWGGSNPSGSREAGAFYPSCASRCQPILGFLLCGLERDV